MGSHYFCLTCLLRAALQAPEKFVIIPVLLGLGELNAGGLCPGCDIIVELDRFFIGPRPGSRVM